MSEHQLGDGPISPEYHQQMNMLARAIDGYLNGEARGDERKAGFVLLVFPFGATDGRCNFISNGAHRADLVALFKEMIARFEGQPEMQGRA
ncbi:hypothetical protein [Bosea minatitlanensis]|uniref:RES domain-containing protein n=1 Tax=Bosea minatitlanensis TaxID=128782 RepID=A0ABW0EYB6_9HYPH|nr:hypothetical protein [Bosea minatitlanensis]MCT4496050.1 hypothetical protein [Bosea minatitlanensis]